MEAHILKCVSHNATLNLNRMFSACTLHVSDIAAHAHIGPRSLVCWPRNLIGRLFFYHLPRKIPEIYSLMVPYRNSKWFNILFDQLVIYLLGNNKTDKEKRDEQWVLQDTWEPVVIDTDYAFALSVHLLKD